jgi:Ca-activated chloride channel family protein
MSRSTSWPLETTRRIRVRLIRRAVGATVAVGLAALVLAPVDARAASGTGTGTRSSPSSTSPTGPSSTTAPKPVDPPQTSNGSVPTAGAPVPVMVVLDASGSMNAKDAPGARIAAAKKAVDALVDSLPANARVGLLVYGTGTSSAGSAKAKGCHDIKQIVRLGAVNKPAFKAAVAKVTARGYTPIGNSLQAAAALLPKEGPRSIVLVSDGEDTCAPPAPCDTARALKAAGTDLTVHTVGFKVDTTARSQLTCIAAATGGSYRETSDGASLGKILVSRVGEALRPYTAVGTRVHGSSSPVGAQALKPGQYVDSFADAASSSSDDGHAKYYTVNVGAGETLYATVTLVTPPLSVPSSSSLQSVVGLQTPDGDFCESNWAYQTESSGKLAALTNVLTVAQGDKGLPSKCLNRSGQFVLRVVRTGTAFAERTLSAELTIRVEPAGDATGLPVPATTASDDVSPAADAAPTTVDGGSSYDNAPLLAGGTYRDTVVSGEARYYRVHLDFGQRLAYRVGLPAVRSTSATDSMRLQAHLASPVRAQLEQTSYYYSASYYGNAAVVVHGSGDFPARYTNRFSTSVRVRDYAVAGDYYLWLDTSFVTGTQYQLPLTLTVQVVGSKEAGPVYGRRGPTITAPSTTASTSSATTSSRSSAGGGAAKANDSTKSGGTPVWLPLAGIAALLAVAAVAVVAVRRRRVPMTGPGYPMAGPPSPGSAWNQYPNQNPTRPADGSSDQQQW